MYALTYRSKAKPTCTPEALRDILDLSRGNNKKLEITGCLVYHNDAFIQILEGEKKAVKKTFTKIKNDVRHTEITLMWSGACEDRAFPNWNMAYHSLAGNENANALAQFEQNLLILSSFSKKESASIMLFWKNLEKLIIGQQISKFQNNIR